MRYNIVSLGSPEAHLGPNHYPASDLSRRQSGLASVANDARNAIIKVILSWSAIEAMKPYSIDFRQKIIEVYELEKISIRKLALRFRVAKSFIQNLIKKYKETGDIRPQGQGGSRPTKLNSEQLVILVEILENNNDATLEELSELLYEKTGIKVSRATISRMTQKLNYTFKKKLCMRQKKNEQMY